MYKTEYKSVSEWAKANKSEYNKARLNGMLDYICECYEWEKPPKRIIWTKELCIENAKKYASIKKWQKGLGGGEQIARKRGWFDECTKHMKQIIKPKGYWTKELCIEHSKRYTKREDWKWGHSQTYQVARKRGWYNECVEHMKLTRNPKGYWTKKRCLETAKKYKNRTEWTLNSSGAEKASRKFGWIDECIEHMEDGRSNREIYWTKERCIQEAKKYKTRGEWSLNSNSYKTARLRGWADECTTHMKRIIKPQGYWDIKENVLEEAKKYKTKSDWAKKQQTSYSKACKFGWLNESTKHMLKRAKKG